MQEAHRPFRKSLGRLAGGSPRRGPVQMPLRRLARPVRLLVLALIVGASLGSLAGCSLFVMAGKMLLGDPQQTSRFKEVTGADLVKGGQKLLVLCSSADSIKSEHPSLDYDLLNGVARRLKVRGIRVVDPDAVGTWLDDHGGQWGDIGELAGYFGADFVVHMNLTKFTCREENSPSLLRGQGEGRIIAYRINKTPDGRRVTEVMDHEFTSEHPHGYPVSIEKVSAKLFTQQYVERICTKLAQMFYDHPLSEEEIY